MKIIDTFPTVEECLIEFLQTDLSMADEYLSISLEDYSKDNDLDELLDCIHCIATAKGEPLELVDSTVVDKEGLDTLLNVDPNPSWDQVIVALTT